MAFQKAPGYGIQGYTNTYAYGACQLPLLSASKPSLLLSCSQFCHNLLLSESVKTKPREVLNIRHTAC